MPQRNEILVEAQLSCLFAIFAPESLRLSRGMNNLSRNTGYDDRLFFGPNTGLDGVGLDPSRVLVKPIFHFGYNCLDRLIRNLIMQQMFFYKFNGGLLVTDRCSITAIKSNIRLRHKFY